MICRATVAKKCFRIQRLTETDEPWLLLVDVQPLRLGQVHYFFVACDVCRRHYRMDNHHPASESHHGKWPRWARSLVRPGRDRCQRRKRMRSIVEFRRLQLRMLAINRHHDVDKHGAHDLPNGSPICFEFLNAGRIHDESYGAVQFRTIFDHQLVDVFRNVFSHLNTPLFPYSA